MTPQDYYQKAVIDYLVGDTKSLLDRKEDRCGIILAPVLSGIETIGGSLHGFERNNSRQRAVSVMTTHHAGLSI